ncbi:MAG: hypothetical protein QOF28_1521 [Actinomycetota bacterium]|nr:hypothetical protein [Actinomycetota bacterium]
MADDDNDDQRSGGLRSGEFGSRVRLVGLTLVLVVLLLFALSNRNDVKVDFLVVDAKVRLVYALAFSAALGALADRIATFRNRHR